jgi:hypothetical protein
MFLNNFNVLVLKIIFKKIKNIILIYFKITLTTLTNSTEPRRPFAVAFQTCPVL